jgi:hypothetical protein
MTIESEAIVRSESIAGSPRSAVIVNADVGFVRTLSSPASGTRNAIAQDYDEGTTDGE